MHRYGMKLEQWDSLIELQRGGCAICGHVPDGSRGKRDRRLHVDHEHSTGRVRALLCHQCNNMIGYAKECPDRLERAASYIKAHVAR